MNNTLQELYARIRPVPNEMLELLPENEANVFKNYTIFPIELLVPADWNYKLDDELQAEKLLNNLKLRGQIITCQVRRLETGYLEVIDGNHRLKGLHKLGNKYVFCYDHKVITLAQAQRLAIESNETKFSADREKLAQIIRDIKLEIPEIELRETMPYSDEEFNDLVNSALNGMNSREVESADVQDDNFEPKPVRNPKTKAHDLYELVSIEDGITHRLYCGDSTSPADVAILMNGEKAMLLHSDPPYNVSYADLSHSRNDGEDDGSYFSNWTDSMSDEDYKKFITNFLKNAKNNLDEWAHYYVWHATTFFREILDVFEELEIPYDKVPIQWVKQVAPLSWVRYKRKSEPCIFGGKGAVNGAGTGARWFGPNNETNIWEINREHSGTYVHPTQKPLELVARAIRNSSKTGELVLDLFGGSGSTMLGCQQLGRRANLMEMDEKFCDMIVLRFTKYMIDNNLEYKVLRNGEEITQPIDNLLRNNDTLLKDMSLPV